MTLIAYYNMNTFSRSLQVSQCLMPEAYSYRLFTMNLSSEIQYQTTRSGGKGGQNVNKLETAVIASFHIETSQLLTDTQKKTILEKLSNRISKEGFLQVKSQTYRTQIENKEDATGKINELVTNALKKKKLRIATKPSKQAKERRIESKKRLADIKSGRRKFRDSDS